VRADDLFRAVIEAPDRDHCPGARPVVSYAEDDDGSYLDAIDARAVRRVALRRRDAWHGEWAELEEDAAAQDTFPREARLAQRWHDAQPIVLRGLLDAAEATDVARGRDALFDKLVEPGGLRAFLRGVELPRAFELGAPQALADPERDLERHGFTWRREEDGGGPTVRDLWAKSAWLSAHDDDRSLRLRVSFGKEGPDDASRDHLRHRRVAELAEALLPEAALLSGDEVLRERLDNLAGEPVFLTQHIAYWNAPNGGARFHHDAFGEDVVGGQLGVVYAQLGGTTAWLALSTSDLAARVLEALEYMEEGELGWVRQALWPDPAAFERQLKLARNPKRCARELTRPGCGALGRLVDRGPEFTALLADAGHALVLGPGDVLLLPNHGLSRTCMHSVFCASEEEVAYGLSTAVRALHPPGPPEEDRAPSLRRQRVQRRRRRR